MLTLYLLRHAEAASAKSDFDRPLTAGGVADLKAMALRLESFGLRPEFALCSPAKRTRMTLKNLWPDIAARFPDQLYNADAGTHYETVKAFGDSYGSVLIVAHNPGILNFVRFLAAPGPVVPVNYNPGTLTVLECAIDCWSDLMPGENRVVRVLEP